VLDALAMQPGRGDGRTVMFVSGRRGAGVTSVARAVAEVAGARRVYALDLDLKRNALTRALTGGARLGARQDGRIDGQTFYSIRGPGGALVREVKPAFSFHRVGASRVYAGLFDAKALPPGGRLVISSAPNFWDAVRSMGAMAVVDAPSLDRSEIALRVARNMDGVVLVVGDAPGEAPAATAAKAALDAAGANVIGLVYAGASAPVMAIDRLLRQAG
jgi:Mrp family chromosome partitioning ATPase